MSFLDPQSIAVIGASATEGKVGHDIFKNLLMQGFAGKVHPVNPKHPDVLGVKTTASVKDIPGAVDMAVIVIPAPLVPDALKECAEKGIKTAIVISAGFSEIHAEEGKKLEEEVVAIARKAGIKLVGPNCLGVLRPPAKMNASFAKNLPPAGSVALISQSGATAVALIDAAPTYGIGFSAVLSIGNKAAMDESDFLEICADDEATKVIGFYLESIKDGRRFLETARTVAQKKPIVLLKAGVSEHGKKAASSHTGALAGSDAAIDALCAQSGIRRAHTSQELFDFLSVLSNEPPLLSEKIAIITNAGGPGILATDSAEKESLTLPRLEESSEKKLREKLPASASTQNPIDVIGDAGADRYVAAIAACRDDPNIDGVAVLLTPQVMTPCEEIARAITDLMKTAPLMSVVTSFMGGRSVEPARQILRIKDIPTFDTPERAIHALASLQRRKQSGKTSYRFETSGMRAARAGEIMEGHAGLLPEDTVEKLFKLYALPLPKQALATSTKEAAVIAKEIGCPVIAKISSPDILHKTDVGGIQANLQSERQVEEAFDEILSNVKKHCPKAKINGVLIQKFLPIGNEFIVGSVKDASFGPLVMVGLGGIYTELFRDTAFRIAPIHEEEAYEMLQTLKSWKLLLGMRGKKQSDIDALAQLIATVSQMVIECPHITELDMNPVLVGEKGVIVADAKVVV